MTIIFMVLAIVFIVKYSNARDEIKKLKQQLKQYVDIDEDITKKSNEIKQKDIIENSKAEIINNKEKNDEKILIQTLFKI